MSFNNILNSTNQQCNIEEKITKSLEKKNDEEGKRCGYREIEKNDN